MRVYKSFREFWPFYLREHSRPRTRALHYAGTTLVVLIAVAAAATGNWWLLIAMPIAGYGFAWGSHAAVERNRPATFTYPDLVASRGLSDVVAVADRAPRPRADRGGRAAGRQRRAAGWLRRTPAGVPGTPLRHCF
jgi:hypothetical protein